MNTVTPLIKEFFDRGPRSSFSTSTKISSKHCEQAACCRSDECLTLRLRR